MKAIVQDSYGSADVLEVREIERPGVENDEVLVCVHAAGVDPGVWHVMTGLPYLIRIAGYGFRLVSRNPENTTDQGSVRPSHLIKPATCLTTDA
jgi:hypothetical protein